MDTYVRTNPEATKNYLEQADAAIETVSIANETWFKISNHDKMRPFFMNVVSDSNHWMFISSNGGLSAGRKNSEFALFPYYTDDKITESADITGSKTIFRVKGDGGADVQTWEPFSQRYTGRYKISRNLYKNFYGNKLMFEETNHDLGLTFRYQWNSSNLYGFVRKAEVENHSGAELHISMLDGIQNLLPYGVEPDLQNESSNLVDAYKRSELVEESGLGIYALSAIIVDKAEPSEALKANVVWSKGIDNPKYLVSSLQLDAFRKGDAIESEDDIKGEKGAYFIHTDLELSNGSSRSWNIVANVNQNHAQITALNHSITQKAELEDEIEADIARGSATLRELVAGADGLRLSADSYKDARHFSNVLFNIMRGGTFDHNYQIEKADFSGYLANASKEVFERNQDVLKGLKDTFTNTELYKLVADSKDRDFYRLSREYLPLKFSRRHGDPSRPWNKFSINTHSEIDGSKILDYQGNWRDIFQNWEALVHSYPGFIEGMIFKFLNTSTFDGYNPYRVTKGGFDWETIEPDNPWSYIGYWGDHQIIYMLKFLEFYRNHKPGGFDQLLENESFVYANVPYRIKPYEQIARDHKNTIDFDFDADHAIHTKVAQKGADGSLLSSGKNDIHHVGFMEKILASVLAKVSNFIPEGGIWMNTQRPEWNDANNALVGNGVSMVTLYYLRRFLQFFDEILSESKVRDVELSSEMKEFFTSVASVLNANSELIAGSINDSDRKAITDALGKAGSTYRTKIYDDGFSGEKVSLSLGELKEFVKTSLKWMEHSIEANRREDNLFHAYNIMSMEENSISISYLSEMLEGQVAVLSAKYLSSEDALGVIESLRNSALYRKDQKSYMLYPNKQLPRFLEKNTIPASEVEHSPLLQKLVADGNMQLIHKDIKGEYHFDGNFRNAADVKAALETLKGAGYESLVEKDGSRVLQIFEKVFNHKAFTGRSGTFYAFEGLGSIYWHMVSKLYVAVGEICEQAKAEGAPKDIQDKLAEHFYAVAEGIGVHKSPAVYGAFPTDAYSHTPWHRGAQQPGMTGQVKEDILANIAELGVNVESGKLSFSPFLLRKDEFSGDSLSLSFVDITKQVQEFDVPADALLFSCCQVPVTYRSAGKNNVEVVLADGSTKSFDGSMLDHETSAAIFDRTGVVKSITVSVDEKQLR